MSRIEIEAKGLFATPVAAVLLPDAEIRKAELAEVILRRRAQFLTLGAGDSNSCHYHPGSSWSGSRYVADGGCAEDPSLGGEFEIFDLAVRRR